MINTPGTRGLSELPLRYSKCLEINCKVYFQISFLSGFMAMFMREGKPYFEGKSVNRALLARRRFVRRLQTWFHNLCLILSAAPLLFIGFSELVIEGIVVKTMATLFEVSKSLEWIVLGCFLTVCILRLIACFFVHLICWRYICTALLDTHSH